MTPPGRIVNPIDAPAVVPVKTAPAVVNAFTARGGIQRSPVLHASPYPPTPASAAGSSYRAACGATVRNVTRVAWTPNGPGRHCPACAALKFPAGGADV